MLLLAANYRFIKIFHRLIKDNLDEFRALGVDEHTLGSHSCRKGAITVISTGCTVSPPMASICLRAGWSMGNVKDRYIHYEKAGDQFCGRCVTGLSSLKKEFAVSPVHWDFTKSGERGAKGVKDMIEEKFVGTNEIDPHLFELVTYLFAAVCFHFKYLDETIPEGCKLRGSPLFNAAADFEFRSEAKIEYPWSATKYTPQQTGIPPHTILLVELESLKNELKEGTNLIIEKMKEELDNRSVGGVEYETKEILTQVCEDLCLTKILIVSYKPCFLFDLILGERVVECKK